MKNETGYSERYEEALRLATVAHRDQKRKGNDLPYITHLVHVSVILLRHGFSTEAAIAGLLHDIIEDQGHTLAQIEETFGAQVAESVAALTEKKRDAEGVKRPWDVRKAEGIDAMRRASEEAVAVKAADMIHNAHCFVADLEQNGPKLWEKFSRGPQPQLAYYHKLLDVIQERLDQHPIVDELRDTVAALERAIKETTGNAQDNSPTP